MSESQEADLIWEKYLNNQDMPILNTPFQPKLPVLSNEIEYLEELDQRPVDSHYNYEKGYKFDVTVPDEEKHTSPNIRLGDSDVMSNPLLMLIR